ncbi:hypothetical protein PR048_005088 [Dryococelus australis]|uniref:Retrotransposon gag domain-containing protein n=1 Tax=Dryococelus australis TaxID=614101 RepID=A0ABQ9I7Q1_9NEOP|nr:hypothetical protein PR048_005088 [Dryococelus australis]
MPNPVFLVNDTKETANEPMFVMLMAATTYVILKNVLVPDVLTKHFSLTKMVTAKRFKYHKRNQQQNESVSEYVMAFKILVKT